MELYRFVKASERLPETKVFARLHGKMGLLHSANEYSILFDCGDEGWRYDFTDSVTKEFEWLEPLPESEQDELWKEVGKIIMDGYDNMDKQDEVTKELSSKYHLIKKEQ